MRKPLLIALGLVLVGSVALASNTGFKLNYPLTFNTGRTNINWVSPPYFFYPNGQVGTAQTAQDWCVDLNGAAKDASKVNSLIRFDSASDTPKTKFCTNTLAGFNLVAGESYALVPAAAGITADIVGSHDDNYAPNKGGTQRYNLAFNAGRTNINWVSVPYHSKASTGQDLCVEENGAAKDASKVNSIIRFDTASDTPKTKFCTNTLVGFNLTPGEGYAFVPAAASQSVAFNVY